MKGSGKSGILITEFGDLLMTYNTELEKRQLEWGTELNLDEERGKGIRKPLVVHPASIDCSVGQDKSI